MIVCGVEIKSNEAVVCLLTYSDGVFSLPDCRATRVTLASNTGVEPLKAFQSTFAKLMEDYKVSRVVIRERHLKGKFAGSTVGFKLEAAIQLLDGAPGLNGDPLIVDTFSPAEIKTALSAYPMPVRFEDTELKAFQEVAFTVAYAYLVADEEEDEVS